MRRPGWWPNRRAVALDVAAALFVLVVEIGEVAVNTGESPAPREGWLVVGVLAAVAMLLRRPLPLVLLAVAVVDGAIRGSAFVAMPFAAYAVARYEPRARRRWATLGIAAVVALGLWQFGSLDRAVNNVLNVGFLLVLPAAVGAWVRTRAELMDALRSRAERAESEQQLRAREAVLEERSRITREMHDVVGHRVSLMVLQAGAIEMAATDPERVRRLAGQVQEAGRRSLEELRQLIGLLRAAEDSEPSPLAPMPTLADVEELVGEARQAGVEVTLDRRGEPRPVDATVGRTAYRVVQEALTNAGKHAPGAAVTVTLDYRPAELAVSVLNRRATRQPAALPSGGHGLVGLRERVRTVGGELRAEPRLDGGFGVEAVLPA